MSRAKWVRWVERSSVKGSTWYELPGFASVGQDRNGAWTWSSFHAKDMEEGGGASPEECKAAAEAAIRSHARRLLELVGEEP